MSNTVAVAVLDRAPTDLEAEDLAVSLAQGELENLSWFVSDKLPPREMTGLLLHDIDQLEAEKRDAGESGRYLVVLVETTPSTEKNL